MDELRQADVSYPRRRFLLSAAAALTIPSTSRAIGLGPEDALRNARKAHRQGGLAEHAGARDCIDRYYEGAVFAYAAIAASPGEVGKAVSKAIALYNECLGDCLRAATLHQAIDPRTGLIVQTPRGLQNIPVVHHGFAWSPDDFHRLLTPNAAPRNPANSRDHTRAGLGATKVVQRSNLHTRAEDPFIPDPTFFPATAVLRPNLNAWLGGNGGPGDLLEFHDPLRVPAVDVAGAYRPLAADLDAPIAYLEKATGGDRAGWSGLVNPSQDADRSSLELLEPYQPGKIPIVFVHGLYDTPYTFTDLMNGLRSWPGFLDRYQILGYRYATGLTFLHAAAQFRRDLHRFEAAVDPSRTDPGMQSMVLLGHSMGCLMIKLQIVSSGENLWDLVANRPLATLNAAQDSKAFLSSLFHFQPAPMVRRVVFLAAPHDGLGLTSQPLGALTERLTRKPQDLRGIIDQIDQDDPNALKPYMRNLPNSIGMLRRREPLLRELRDLPVSPAITINTLAGTAKLPAAIAHGDGSVPISSAHHHGAESETLVPEYHTTINSSDYTFVEVRRILQRHATTTAG